jgi:hypothetical protein
MVCSSSFQHERDRNFLLNSAHFIIVRSVNNNATMFCDIYDEGGHLAAQPSCFEGIFTDSELVSKTCHEKIAKTML